MKIEEFIQHIKEGKPQDPKTLKTLIHQMRDDGQAILFNKVVSRPKPRFHSWDNPFNDKDFYFNQETSSCPQMSACSIIDLAIINNDWPAVEVLLEEGFNADQIFDQKGHFQGMPRLHFAYLAGTADMLRNLLRSPKININFRCKHHGEMVRAFSLSFEGYAETILLDALAWSHIICHEDKIRVLLNAPNLDFTTRTCVDGEQHLNYFSQSGFTALDLVLRVAFKQQDTVIKYVELAIMKQVIQRFYAVYQSLNEYFLPDLNKLVAEYEMLAPEELATTEDGKQCASKLTTLTFDFDAQTRTLMLKTNPNQVVNDHLKELQKIRGEKATTDFKYGDWKIHQVVKPRRVAYR